MKHFLLLILFGLLASCTSREDRFVAQLSALLSVNVNYVDPFGIEEQLSKRWLKGTERSKVMVEIEQIFAKDDLGLVTVLENNSEWFVFSVSDSSNNIFEVVNVIIEFTADNQVDDVGVIVGNSLR